MLRSILFLVIAAEWTAVSSTETEIVFTHSGPIRGEEVSNEITSYKAFRGIPYAAPPLGELRFKAPQPPQKWTEVMHATKYGKSCIPPRVKKPALFSEDCLTLNVYTKSLGKNNPKPVLVWVHGGAFHTGTSSDWQCGPDWFMQEDIVLVSINYRLGPAGFLSTNTPDATGNWGLKDQVAALKWVQANIEEFGGDPKQVTFYGLSAGAASVHLHLFSPLSKGLFQRAIVSSAAAGNMWVLKSPDEQERYSRNLARLLGASEEESTDPQKRIQFLRAADPVEMAKYVYEVLDEQDTSNPIIKPLPFTPVIEAPGTEGAFLTQDPVELLAAGKFTKVPLMMGLTDLEGGLLSYWEGLDIFLSPEKRKEVEENVCQILPQPMKDKAIAENACSDIAAQIRDVYFNGEGFDSSFLNFAYLCGDVVITKDIYFSLKMHTKYSDKENPVYNYYFTFDGEWNRRKKHLGVTIPGAVHADELSYVFLQRGYPLPPLPESSPEQITRKRMTSFITNFVKYGNPTPKVFDLVPVNWIPSNQKEFNTMVIGNELTLEKDILKSRMDLWDWLSQTYGTSRQNFLNDLLECGLFKKCPLFRCFDGENGCL